MENTFNTVPDDHDQPNLMALGLGKEEMDNMWQLSIHSFLTNNHEMIIPGHMSRTLSGLNVADLVSRFSAHFSNAEATAFFDFPSGDLHIRRVSEVPATENDSPGMSSSLARSTSAQTMMSISSPSASPVRAPLVKEPLVKPARLPGKKSKVPRPPNAFILYRAKHHPMLKDEKPTLSNNEISVILGKKWREESEQVKTHFKEMADKLKAQHAAQNPGYQYAPRKPSEKKRRMTARKLATLSAARAETDSQSSSDLEMTDVAEVGDSNGHDNMTHDNTARETNEVGQFFRDDEAVSATGLMGSERMYYPSRVRHGNQGMMSVILPAGHGEVERDLAFKMSRMQHFTVEDEMAIGGRTEPSFYNDGPYLRPTLSSLTGDDFMSSLVDWDAIKEDAKWVHSSVNEEKPLETFHFDSKEERAKFQQEIDRILWMLE
ncbi:uncharacterized protein Z520_11763 [Fonsecaea multimorphosa CBS 102226]|uniref:HMG box domain-containing protein n=1 Tax=Fonsecaea multimorphosa CBS 102226 TaxID=1442371 RepID=A0A0D2JHC7_9EURO|nr:uncharacterized protein Z520_11763 [Fonsecaea multimorphosa CBS 102226]KIX92587.1 hypothetical protein Z520_11763 [Fonsecaea multimorphosa CBS 102226]OAL17391.1 hypothetical protein AYO22_11702 [Fonsecaea multimorphosa]